VCRDSSAVVTNIASNCVQKTTSRTVVSTLVQHELQWIHAIARARDELRRLVLCMPELVDCTALLRTAADLRAMWATAHAWNHALASSLLEVVDDVVHLADSCDDVSWHATRGFTDAMAALPPRLALREQHFALTCTRHSRLVLKMVAVCAWWAALAARRRADVVAPRGDRSRAQSVHSVDAGVGAGAAAGSTASQ
jgi:hypothetical protein